MGKRKKKKPLTRKYLRKMFKDELKDTIKEKSSKFPHKQHSELKNIPTGSWFDIKQSNHNCKLTCNANSVKVEEVISCEKVKIYPTTDQKRILFKWFDAYDTMFNEANRFLKETNFKNEKLILEDKRLRTYHLKDIKSEIVKASEVTGIKDVSESAFIQGHMLDGAIKDLCTCYKSAITNHKNGNIKKFRIRYLKRTRKNRTLRIDSQYFSKKHGCICPTTLGKTFDTENNYDLRTIKSDCRLMYESNKNQFTLLVPKKEQQDSKNYKNSFAGIDPGLRTFLSGTGNKGDFEIANNTSQKIRHHLRKIDEIKNKNLPSKIKKRYERLNYTKIKNSVDELHWKSIKYLTNNYQSIFIGNLSTKEIGLKNKSNLNRMTKRVGQNISYYKFLQKLEYKCTKYNLSLHKVHEGYTSKLCSNCGDENDKLGSSKVFKCDNCDLKLDRDLNGARNILFKGINKSKTLKAVVPIADNVNSNDGQVEDFPRAKPVNDCQLEYPTENQSKICNIKEEPKKLHFYTRL